MPVNHPRDHFCREKPGECPAACRMEHGDSEQGSHRLLASQLPGVLCKLQGVLFLVSSPCSMRQPGALETI